MNLKRGELVYSFYHDYGTAVWDAGLENGLDVIQHDEISLVIKDTDDYGWTRIVTPRGICGIVHQGNLKRIG